MDKNTVVYLAGCILKGYASNPDGLTAPNAGSIAGYATQLAIETAQLIDNYFPNDDGYDEPLPTIVS